MSSPNLQLRLLVSGAVVATAVFVTVYFLNDWFNQPKKRSYPIPSA